MISPRLLLLVALLFSAESGCSTSFPTERWGRVREQKNRIVPQESSDSHQEGQSDTMQATTSDGLSGMDSKEEATFREEMDALRKVETDMYVERKRERDYCILHGLPSPPDSPRRKQKEEEVLKGLREEYAQRRQARVQETEQKYPLKVEYEVGTPKLFCFQKYREEPLEALDFGKPEKNWKDYFSPDENQTIIDNYAMQVYGSEYPYDVFALGRLGNRDLGYALLSQDRHYHYLAVNHLIKLQLTAAKHARAKKT